MIIALSFTWSKAPLKVSIGTVLGAALHITNKVTFDIQKSTCSCSLCQVSSFILPQMPFLFSQAEKHLFRKCSHSRKDQGEFSLWFQAPLLCYSYQLGLKDPERIHLSLHCFLNKRHEGLINDCDEEDPPRTAEIITNTKLKKSRTQESTVHAVDKGKKPNTLQDIFPTNKSFWLCL